MTPKVSKPDVDLYNSKPLKKDIISYDEDTDDLYVQVRSGGSFKTVEVGSHLLLDYDEAGNIIGFEVMNAKRIIKRALSEMSDKHSIHNGH